MEVDAVEKWLKRLKPLLFTESYDKEAALTLEVISMIDEPELEEVAVNRYIHNKKWLDVAEASYISKATVYRYRTKILEKVAKILRKEGINYGKRTEEGTANKEDSPSEDEAKKAYGSYKN